MDINISPIFYMGNKKKLIQKGLIELFPDDIDLFVDLFAGSGIVSMNVQAKEYVLNDINKHCFELYNIFKKNNPDEIISHIENRINEYGLAKERTKRNQYKDKQKLDEYKIAYMEFRDYYNKNKHSLDFVTLMFFAFSQQFRFNRNGTFNMPMGNDCFSEKNKKYIHNGCDFFSKSNVSVRNEDFLESINWVSRKNDFVYLDPPYYGTNATYNENNDWGIKDENKLLEYCEMLNKNGFNWGMSNIFSHKGKQNTHLIEWCDKNGWSVYRFDNFSYMACGKGNCNAEEVYICNY